jgi:hypothetical protein
MKKWVNPVKNRPAKESTLNTRGDFEQFIELMKRAVNAPKPEEKRPKPVPSSRVPDVS